MAFVLQKSIKHIKLYLKMAKLHLFFTLGYISKISEELLLNSLHIFTVGILLAANYKMDLHINATLTASSGRISKSSCQSYWRYTITKLQ